MILAVRGDSSQLYHACPKTSANLVWSQPRDLQKHVGSTMKMAQNPKNYSTRQQMPKIGNRFFQSILDGYLWFPAKHAAR